VSSPIWGPGPDFSYYQTVRVCSCGAPSLTRGRVCRLQLLLGLASAVILRSESRGTQGHILLPQIRYFPNLEGHVPAFVSPRHRVPTSSPSTTRRWRWRWRWRYSYPPPHGPLTAQSFLALVSSSFETRHRKINRNNIFQFVPHRKHFVSMTTTNRLILFREIIAVYCENHTEHTSTLCA
jgi:hypothetical protein